MSQDNSHEFDVAALYQLSSRIEEIYSMLTRDAHLRIIEQSPILESIVGNNKEQWVTLKGASEYTSLSIAKLRRAVSEVLIFGIIKTTQRKNSIIA